jgi:preprotein translocase subunit YajC
MLHILLTADTAVNPAMSGISTIVMLVAMLAIFYFFMYRPQKKQEKETQEMRNSIEIGDVISTVGGIIGVVVRIKDEMLLIESGADRTRIQIQKWAVRGVEERAHPEAHEVKDTKKLKK